jgi:hypothetical protein
MRIISIAVLATILGLVQFSPRALASEENNTNININIDLKDNLENIVGFLTQSATSKTAEAQTVAEPEPEVIAVEEPQKTPEELK